MADTVMQVPIAGGTPVPLAANQYWAQSGIVVDATNVYWTTNNQGDNVHKAPIRNSGFASVSIVCVGTTSNHYHAVVWIVDSSAILPWPKRI
jgi:hypothetical protein